MRAIYVADTEGVVAVAAASTIVVFGVEADAGHAIDLLGLAFSIDQATPTASDKGVLVSLGSTTFATNAPGAGGSTGVTIDQESGPRIAETFTAAKSWAVGTPPTVITPLRPYDVDPYKFTYENNAMEMDFGVADGFCLTVVNPTGNQSLNVRVWARWARV